VKKYLKMAGNILLYGGIYFGFQIFVMVVFMIVFGINEAIKAQDVTQSFNFSDAAANAFFDQNLNIIMLVSEFISLLTFMLIFYAKKQNLFKYCGFFKLSLKNAALIVVMASGMGMFIDGILTALPIDKWFPEYSELMDSLMGGGQDFSIILLSVGILGPIFEEILFRGLVFNELRKVKGLVFSVIVQAILFGVFHMNWLQGIYAFLLGIILGLVYVWTRSIWAPIIAHIVFNTSSVFGGFLSLIANIYVVIALGLILTVISLFYLYRNRKTEYVLSETVSLKHNNIL
jgi:membrane protease YdiL (CAAX protease family)